MKSFAYLIAESFGAAAKALSKGGVAKAGGTDLLDRLKDRVVEPDEVVHLLRIEKKETRRGPRVSMLPQWRFVSTAGVEPHAGVGELVASFEAKLGTLQFTPSRSTSIKADPSVGSERPDNQAAGV